MQVALAGLTGPTRLLLALALCTTLAGCAATEAWSGLLWWIQTVQRDLHRELAAAMRTVSKAGPGAGWTLAGLSLAYGVFHAAGPGHGKAVIATYVATQVGQLRRGLWLSLLSSLAQGVTAILIVEAAMGVFALSMRRAQAASTQFENISFALVALLGLMLVWSNGRRLAQRRQQARLPAVPPSMFSRGGAWQAFCNDCGSMHSPGAAHLQAPLQWRTLAGTILAIGIRPCSGAVLVLLVAHALQLRWAGIAAVAAMSLGTAATVAVLATLSVYARKLSLRLLGSRAGLQRHTALILDMAGIAGGLLICLIGMSLLSASLSTPAHPLF